MKSRDRNSQSGNDLDQFGEVVRLFEGEAIATIEKIEAFPKYASRQAIAKFLTKYEIFKHILHVNGSIVECGVLHGAGLLAWAKLSSIFEPANHVRKVIGFDTFAGFPSLTAQDTDTGEFGDLRPAGLTGSTYDNVAEAVRVYDLNRPISHIPKVELVAGDLAVTAAKYLADNPHLVVSLLYLDVDLYEPTKIAIETFLPRMPKGAVIAFDELNAKIFPGETIAAADTVGLRNLRIQRFPFDSYVSYAVLE
jgi:hypothetical protein